jgi:hypothetical protein
MKALSYVIPAAEATLDFATSRQGITTLGMAGTLYAGSSQLVKAVEAKNVTGKIGHGALAAISFAATAAIPYRPECSDLNECKGVAHAFIDTATHCVAQGIAGGQYAFEGLRSISEAATTRSALTVAGMAVPLFLGVSEFVKAVKADSISSRLGHGFVATLGFASAAMVPFIPDWLSE